MTYPESAMAKLRDALAVLPQLEIFAEIVVPRDQVFARFQPLLLSQSLQALTESEFRDFLHYEHNHHWTGLHRAANWLCADMDKLKQTLGVLLDESRPVAERLDEVAGAIKGLGKATVTAILHVAYPSKYGVWNNTSDGAMTSLGIYPEFERGESFGSRYEKINVILKDLATELKTDLWTLDALWWQIESPGEAPIGSNKVAAVHPVSPNGAQQFALERHLHVFIRDNWNALTVGGEWSIYSTPEDDVGRPAGYEYPCAVGRIDILGRHKTAKRWLVIEVKRGQPNDVVVGQLMRYMGWIKRHLAEPTDEIYGMIIAKDVDDALQYAASIVPNVTVLTYRIEFTLDAPKPLPPK